MGSGHRMNCSFSMLSSPKTAALTTSRTVETELTMNEMKKHIFISYKSDEIAYAQALRDVLDSLGYDVWWDRHVQPSGKWNEEIDLKLATAACVVVLWSRRSVNSKWVGHEASSAIARNVLVPCLIEDTTIPPPFDRYQSQSLVGWRGAANDNRFLPVLSLISKLIGDPPNQSPVVQDFSPWPKQVPQPKFGRVIQWSVKNVVGLLGVGIALLVLVLAIGIPTLRSKIAELNDENTRVGIKLTQLNAENGKIHANALEAVKKTERLRDAIKAVVQQVHVENKRLIVSIPKEITAKAWTGFAEVKAKEVFVDTTSIIKPIYAFDGEIERASEEILKKVSDIESLFNVITSEPVRRTTTGFGEGEKSN